MTNTDIKTILLALIIVSFGTLGLTTILSASSPIRDLENQRMQLNEDLIQIREQKIASYSALMIASGAYANALAIDKDIYERIQRKKDEIQSIEKQISEKTGENFTNAN